MVGINLTIARVLVVDDASESRASLRQALSIEPGIEVVGEAGSGPEAVAQAEALRPDIVLMDVRMPGGDGIEATRAIARRLPDTNIVALTAHDDAETVREMLAAGATGYVVKGSSIDELIAAVLTARSGEGSLDERVLPHAVEDLRRLLAEERERGDEIERLARMREEFVHVLSHELRTPLTVMIGALRFFERTAKGEMSDLVSSALRRGAELEHLIEGLELIGESSAEGTGTHPSRALDEAITRLDRVPDFVDVSGEKWSGASGRHVARVAYELLTNANRHGRPPVEIRMFRRGREGVVEVRDAGDLDPDPELLRAFVQRDMSTTRQTRGLGLGLFVASRLCEASGGGLEIGREGDRTVARARFVLR